MSRRTQRFGRQGAADGNRNFSKKLSIDELLKSAVGLEERERERERERDFIVFIFLQNVGSSDEMMVAWQDHKLEGTSQSLEKQYLRLTSVSDPTFQFAHDVDNAVIFHRHLILVLFVH